MRAADDCDNAGGAEALCQLCGDEGLLQGFVERKRDVPEEARVPSPHGAPCASLGSGPQIHRSLRALLWYVLSTGIILYRSTVWQDVRLSPRCQLSPRRCHNQSKTMRVSHGLSLTRLPDWHLDVDSTYSGAVAQAKHQEYVPAHDPLTIHTVESRPFG